MSGTETKRVDLSPDAAEQVELLKQKHGIRKKP